MNYIEKLHLEAIKYEEISFTDLDGNPFKGIEHTDYLDIASKSAEITKQFSCEFVEWLWKKVMSKTSWDDLIDEFMKVKTN